MQNATYIRRELRKVAEGIKVTDEEIQTILTSEVLKREVVQGEFAEEAAGRLKKTQKKQVRRNVKKTEVINLSQPESKPEFNQ